MDITHLEGVGPAYCHAATDILIKAWETKNANSELQAFEEEVVAWPVQIDDLLDAEDFLDAVSHLESPGYDPVFSTDKEEKALQDLRDAMWERIGKDHGKVLCEIS